MAIGCDGTAYIGNVNGLTGTAVLNSLNLATAVATPIGTNLGLANASIFTQDMDFDPSNGNLYWAGYWSSGWFSEGGSFRLIDVTTGTSTEPISYSFEDRLQTAGTYSYRLKQIDFDGSYEYSNEIYVTLSIPAEFKLAQNYPNPFNPSTTIEFSIPNNALVTLKVYNPIGEEVAVLVNGELPAGSHSIKFNASGLASGIYIVKMTAGSYSNVIKMNLLR